MPTGTTDSTGANGTTTGLAFVITRTFDAPRDLVFQAFSEAERLAQWWGPKGCKIRVSRLDFRPGGTFHYSMHVPDGHVMWGRFVYREIVSPERLVWVNSFSDEAGGLTRAPFTDLWPLEMVTTVTLSEQDGRTTLRCHVEPLGGTDVERATFLAGHDSMRQGFGGTWDQLAEYLASVRV